MEAGKPLGDSHEPRRSTATPLKVFTFITDPGHGWLRVSRTDLADVGLTDDDFSRYSPRALSLLFLEEDCDAPKFIAAYKAKHGCEPRIVEKYVDRFVKGE